MGEGEVSLKSWRQPIRVIGAAPSGDEGKANQGLPYTWTLAYA